MLIGIALKAPIVSFTLFNNVLLAFSTVHTSIREKVGFTMAERGTVFGKESHSGNFGKSRDRERENRHRLWQLALDARTFFSMARDWMNGSYKNVSAKTLALSIIGLAYFVSPVDIIPDWILGIGQIDDALVLAIVLSCMHEQLENYREWREMNRSVA